MSESKIILDPKVIRAHGVYVYWLKKTAVYVGRSTKGLCRAIEPKHHKVVCLQECDELHFYPCSSKEEACALEIKLIQDLNPKSNTAHSPSNSKQGARSLQKRSVNEARQKRFDEFMKNELEELERFYGE